MIKYAMHLTEYISNLCFALIHFQSRINLYVLLQEMPIYGIQQ